MANLVIHDFTGQEYGLLRTACPKVQQMRARRAGDLQQ
jgi:hypothetical protein